MPWPKDPKDDAGRTRLVKGTIYHLLHAYKCRADECSDSHCLLFQRVLIHMTSCHLKYACQLPYCAFSRRILEHTKKCKMLKCEFCFYRLAKVVVQEASYDDCFDACLTRFEVSTKNMIFCLISYANVIFFNISYLRTLHICTDSIWKLMKF